MRFSFVDACAGVSLASLAIYDVLGIVYLWRDYDVVHGCRASNEDAHAIWPTSLWAYVLVSLLASTVLTGIMAAVPIRRSLETARKTLNQNGNGNGNGLNVNGQWSRFDNTQPRFGLLPMLPDWLFLWVGSVVTCLSLVLTVIAFWGYWELFMARPWCQDRKASFEELDLWHFGRVSFFLQVIASILLYIWGVVYWSAPCCFELSDAFGHSQHP